MTSPLPTVPTLRALLADSVTNWGKLGAPALCERFVLNNGWVFKGRKLPKSYERGPPKNCFQNAADLAAQNRTRLRYVEGYAMRLEFGKESDGKVPGKIYLCLPDEGKSFVAGTFQLELK